MLHVVRKYGWNCGMCESLRIVKYEYNMFSGYHSCCGSATKVSDALWPQRKYTRPPCPSPSPGAYSNSCPLSRWCHPTISSSAVPFSSCPQSFPASGAFPMSLLFASGGQSIGASASVLPVNIQGWFPLWIDWFDLLAIQETLKSSPAQQFKQ